MKIKIMVKKTVSPKVIVILGLIFFAVVAVSVRAATTVGVNVSVEGTLTGTGAAAFTLATNENLSLTNTSATVDTIAVTSTSVDSSGIQTAFTLGNDAAANTVGAFEANVTSATTGDADVVAGVLVNDVTSSDGLSPAFGGSGTVGEYGMYQKGTSWDFGLVTEDAIANVLPASGKINIIGSSEYSSVFSTAVDRAQDDTGLLDIDAKGVEPVALNIVETLTDDADATDNPNGLKVSFYNTSGDADETTAANISYEGGTAASVGANSKILSVNQNDNDLTYPYGIMVTAGGGGSNDSGDNQLTTAIDVSDVDINSAINIGSNFFKTTDLRFFQSTSSQPFVITFEESTGGTDMMTLTYNNGTSKGDMALTGTLGIGGGTAIAKHLSTTSSIDNTNIAANTCESFTAQGTGVVAGDTVLATPGADGATALSNKTIVWSAFGTAGTINLRVCNPTASALGADPSAVVWRFDIWQH